MPRHSTISDTGELTFDPVPDFEVPTDTGTGAMDNIYEVTVQADDGGMTDELAVLVTVEAVDEPPAIAGPADETLAENSTHTYTYTTTEPEGAAVAWETLGGPDAQLFTFVNGSTQVHRTHRTTKPGRARSTRSPCAPPMRACPRT